jgi:hypothetical protein
MKCHRVGTTVGGGRGRGKTTTMEEDMHHLRHLPLRVVARLYELRRPGGAVWSTPPPRAEGPL